MMATQALPLSSRPVHRSCPGELAVTVNPIARTTVAVLPVVDYEPPARAVTHRQPPPDGPGREQVPSPRPSRPARMAPSATARSAAAFVDTTLRRVLEVIDRRRPATHLRPLLTADLIDSVLAGRPAVSGREAATLRRLRLQAVGNGPPVAVEVFGSYRRGRRIHALAGRIVPVRTPTGPSWQLVALHIG